MLNTSKNVNEKFYIALYSLLNAGYSSTQLVVLFRFYIKFSCAIVFTLHLTNKEKIVPVLN
jgi:hypothetical protein